MTPHVSILMPVYKTADYLREAVDSMLNQTFTDFELIVLNDCSPDNADEILDTYTDSRIVRYKGEKNQGLANVLNVGMDMARGKYIARMDSDDISLPDRLQKQVDYLDSHKDVDLCSCGMEQFGAGHAVWLRDGDVEAVKFRALFHSPILHASSMWRKESFSDMRFDQGFVPAEDYELWTRGLVRGLKMVNLPWVGYRYRIFPQQATANTQKVDAKSIDVRCKYVASIFPEASGTAVDKIARLQQLASADIDELENVLHEMIRLNGISHYFDCTFQARCKRYFQNALFVYMQNNGVRLRNIMKLRPKQIVKLISRH